MKKFLLLLLLLPSLISADEPLRHGMIRTEPSLAAWDTTVNAWVGPKVFWKNYVASRGGLTWAESTEYPPYGQVKEHDTFLVRVPSGVCLMEFFHTRWRRANDVRRWDEKFNEYGGCADVFK